MKEKMKKIMKDNGYIIAMEDVKDANQIFEDWYINKDYARV
jgi:hypothetical protein